MQNKIIKYTEKEHKIWSVLYSRMMLLLPETADSAILEGLKKIGFPSDHIPDFDEINGLLQSFTDWKLVPLEEMVSDNEFIGMLADKKYPCRTWIRSQEQVDSEADVYDIFHDVLGHTPLLTKPNYCAYLQGLGKLALEYINNEKAILTLKRIYWHTIQYGLKTCGNSLKIYGAHLITSRAETLFSTSAGVPKYNFNLEKIIETPYIKNRFQERYFVIEKYEELNNSLSDIEKLLKDKYT
ncbi:phenylalanine 4-monooxygenase [Cytophagaceae bacterium ABcell3]|nr:phenylalanine 4-monooxygenase [Cytophagaceae bacterium ABcell3]